MLDGTARLTAVIPPVADHLSVTIRKYTVKDYDLQFLVDRDAMSQPAAAFLWATALATTTMMFSGPPGAGKTTLLSAYLRAAPNDKCIRVCEEVRELHVPLIHGSFYEASPPTLEGTRRYTLRDLVKVVLAQRPDLICVGEVRRAEAPRFEGHQPGRDSVQGRRRCRMRRQSSMVSGRASESVSQGR